MVFNRLIENYMECAESFCLMTLEPYLNPKRYKEEKLAIIFETFRCPATYNLLSCVSALYAREECIHRQHFRGIKRQKDLFNGTNHVSWEFRDVMRGLRRRTRKVHAIPTIPIYLCGWQQHAWWFLFSFRIHPLVIHTFSNLTMAKRKKKSVDLYEKFFGKNARTKAFQLLYENAFENNSDVRFIYGGSFCHLAPSLYFCDGIYVDTDKRANVFFKQPDMMRKHLSRNCLYNIDDEDDKTSVRFIHQSYETPLPDVEDNSVDLLISSYSGIASAPLKRYLKEGGYLFCNDSHGDASSAANDPDFHLIAGVSQSEEWITSPPPFDKSTEFFLFRLRPKALSGHKRKRIIKSEDTSDNKVRKWSTEKRPDSYPQIKASSVHYPPGV